ncbi:MAG: hypothetical protein JWO58_2416 [Chitinophagaceae bacterium]|nr:hypothetical protein [Chitinophagaceae bacterium]
MFKRIFFGSNVLLAMVCYNVTAQNAALTNAILYLENDEAAKAKPEIDAAVQNEKTKSSAKAWYYRGMIYNKLMTTNPTNTYGYADTAVVSFNKAKTLDKSTGQFYQMSDLRLQDQWVISTNDGVKRYQEENYASAVKSFKLAHLANVKDTTALLYGAYAATANKDQQQAFEFAEELKKNNYVKAYVYKTISDYYLDVKGDPAKAEAELKEGLVKNPNDPALLQDLANFYITTDKNEQAVQTLSLLEKANPNDPLVLVNIAVQYQKFNQPDQAEKYYLKVLDKEPNNYIALFNLGSLYVDKSRSKLNVYNSLNSEQYKKQGPALKSELSSNYSKALDYCKKALPYAESADDKAKLNTMISDLDGVLKTLNK